MDKFLDTYTLPSLNQEKVKSLNRTMRQEWISYKPKKVQDETVHRWILPEVQKELVTFLSKLFQTIQKKRILPNLFYETNIILIPKPGIDTTKKENFRPISIVNIDAKIFNKILANQLQQHIKKLIHHDKVGFALGHNSPHKQNQRQKSHDYLNRFREALWQNSTAFTLKTLNKLGIDGPYLKIIKAIYDKPNSQYHTEWAKTGSIPFEIWH